ncbi:MAG: flagellar hook-basal body complex protein FliE [Acidobacteria bacterium]|jgi:flagellar hook-basal body complex protein FliE|nr:flagellar hook-basal body complex protein FliE [Acidobacteriota bacterium]
MAIEMVQAVAQAATTGASGAKTAATGFGESLESMLKAVESTGAEANDAVGRMMTGQGDVHTALIAMQHADTTFQLTVQVRNKLVQAYQDVMRMPI